LLKRVAGFPKKKSKANKKDFVVGRTNIIDKPDDGDNLDLNRDSSSFDKKRVQLRRRKGLSKP
jgi:hypothetical protein